MKLILVVHDQYVPAAANATQRNTRKHYYGSMYETIQCFGKSLILLLQTGDQINTTLCKNSQQQNYTLKYVTTLSLFPLFFVPYKCERIKGKTPQNAIGLYWIF